MVEKKWDIWFFCSCDSGMRWYVSFCWVCSIIVFDIIRKFILLLEDGVFNFKIVLLLLYLFIWVRGLGLFVFFR